MGVFDVTCAVSDLALRGAIRMVMISAPEVDGVWRPIAAPLEGSYDRYGSIEDIVASPEHRSLGSVLERLEPRLPRPGDLVARLRQMNHGPTEQLWYRWQGHLVTFALVDDRIYRAVIAGVEKAAPKLRAKLARRPWRELLAETLGSHPLIARLYERVKRATPQLERALVDFALFQQSGHTWDPINVEDGDQYCGLTGEFGCMARVKVARKRYAKQLLLLAAVEANAADWAELDDEDVLSEWFDEQDDRFRASFHIAQSFPELPAKPAARKPAKHVVTLGKLLGDVETLAAAIKRVPANGTIYVRKGVYKMTKGIETRKPFTLVGEGAARSVLLFDTADDGLWLIGPGRWRLEGVSCVVLPRKKVGADVVVASKQATLEAIACMFGGAHGVTKGELTTGGVGVRGVSGGAVMLRDCHVAFNHWGVCVHDGAKAAIEGGQVYGCEHGVFGIHGGRTRIDGTTFSGCRNGISVHGVGDDVQIDVVRSVVERSWGAGVFSDHGRIVLTSCTLARNGGAGAGCSETGTLEIADCTATGNSGHGFLVLGRIRLDGSIATENAEHGLLLGPASTGVVRGNRFTRNAQLGVLQDPASRVVLEGNRFAANKRGTTKVAAAK